MKNILLSRTDNIGVVVLSLPLAAYLKKISPHLKIFFLARDYTQAVVEAYPEVDEFISLEKLFKAGEQKALAD